MPSTTRLSRYRTAVAQKGATLSVIYAATLIVSADATTVTLNSGGWRTVTTKRKMSQAAAEFGLGFKVFQHKREWYVRLAPAAPGEPARVLPYHDGIVLPRARA